MGCAWPTMLEILYRDSDRRHDGQGNEGKIDRWIVHSPPDRDGLARIMMTISVGNDHKSLQKNLREILCARLLDVSGAMLGWDHACTQTDASAHPRPSSIIIRELAAVRLPAARSPSTEWRDRRLTVRRGICRWEPAYRGIAATG